MYKVQRRKLLSQNFLKDPKLVNKLLGKTTIGKNDLVLDIGAGKGIITDQLNTFDCDVIAYEIDKYFIKLLESKYQNKSDIQLVNGNFLNQPLPLAPYKVFSNIPFSIEGKIIRKLIEAKKPPDDCYLIIVRELAVRLIGDKNKENLFSILHKPWFDFSIPYTFSPDDFAPVPKVVPVLFKFIKKTKPDLPWSQRYEYQSFIQKGFGNGTSIQSNLKRYYSKSQVEKNFQKISIKKSAKPTHLDLNYWMYLYLEFSRNN